MFSPDTPQTCNNTHIYTLSTVSANAIQFNCKYCVKWKGVFYCVKGVWKRVDASLSFKIFKVLLKLNNRINHFLKFDSRPSVLCMLFKEFIFSLHNIL